MSGSLDEGHDDSKASPPATDDGGTTQDMTERAARYRATLADPERTIVPEERMRTRGLWLIITGAIFIVLTMVIALVYRAGFGKPMPYEIVIPLYGIGLLAVALGCTERLNRVMRRNLALALAEVDKNHKQHMSEMARVENGLFMLVGLLGEELAQRWYAGYGTAAGDFSRTGTDNSRAIGSADVVQFQRRQNRPPG